MNNLSIADDSADAMGLYGINFYIIVSDPQMQKNLSALTMTFTALDPAIQAAARSIFTIPPIEGAPERIGSTLTSQQQSSPSQ
ncbi:3158_t:CDS:2 [Ambispora gerdemannii]|uniref:3158_t:CDS:1 n=1 Tax=Ambispora gerdemannii TaxID=144530 RepID=A0A9N9C2N3_9GLOM|nr:3158_t:CDS:2 [Ambispora gerdemannii]